MCVVPLVGPVTLFTYIGRQSPAPRRETNVMSDNSLLSHANQKVQRRYTDTLVVRSLVRINYTIYFLLK